MEEEHEVQSHTSIQTEGKTDRVCALCLLLISPGLSQMIFLDELLVLANTGRNNC